MKRILILLTILISHSVFAQNGKLDSMLAVLKSHPKNDTAKVSLELKLCELYRNTGDKNNLIIAHEANALAIKLDNKRNIPKSYMYLGMAYYMNFDRAFYYFQMAIKSSKILNDSSTLARVYSSLGEDIILKDYSPSDQKKDDSKKSIVYLDSAINLANLICDTATFIHALSRKGDVLTAFGKFAEARKFYKNALLFFDSFSQQERAYGLLTAIGGFYFTIHDYDSAILYYQRALTFSIKTMNNAFISFCEGQMALAINNTGNHQLALEKCKEGMKVAEKYGLIKEKMDNLFVLTNIYYSMNDFKNALEYYDIMVHIKDSLNKTQLNETESRFNMQAEAARNAEKVSLLEKDKQIQQLIRNSLIIGFVFVLIFAGVFFRQRNKITKEKNRSEELLLNILPAEVAEELKQKGTSDAKDYEEVTVLFTDFKDFTLISEKMTPSELVKEIDYCFSAFDKIIHKHGIEKIKTIGDAYMCAGGLPIANKTHAEDTVKAALEIRDFMANHNQEKLAKGELPFEIRIGINTGPVVAGIVGVKKFAYDIWGDTVNLASRMESSGEAGKVNISGSTFELIKDKFTCEHRGKIQTKNKGEVDMYFVS